MLYRLSIIVHTYLFLQIWPCFLAVTPSIKVSNSMVSTNQEKIKSVKLSLILTLTGSSNISSNRAKRIEMHFLSRNSTGGPCGTTSFPRTTQSRFLFRIQTKFLPRAPFQTDKSTSLTPNRAVCRVAPTTGRPQPDQKWHR